MEQAFHYDFTIAEPFLDHQKEVLSCVLQFEQEGELFGDGERNEIRLFDALGMRVNVKRFKNPNIVNTWVYRYIRPSKAERSFTYAEKLIKLGVGTPKPIAFAENKYWNGLKDSYYLSEHLECDLTYRELVHDANYPDHEVILQAFTRFTFKLHESGVLFKDHSPGNTLIKKTADGYEFFLVDLNRMEFKTLSKAERILNFARLTPVEDMVRVMSDEYAALAGYDAQDTFEQMWGHVSRFQHKYHRKRRLKKKLLFWRKR
ncbi:lipopolysaccharide kinase InaA family protein [Gilvibacter sp.]|uniref:lipopolysaccharide kinase InaA family protein n=1 Tax=Gilvibacter sp. TaxID=2729997 RepID=UPI003F4A1EAE